MTEIVYCFIWLLSCKHLKSWFSAFIAYFLMFSLCIVYRDIGTASMTYTSGKKFHVQLFGRPALYKVMYNDPPDTLRRKTPCMRAHYLSFRAIESLIMATVVVCKKTTRWEWQELDLGVLPNGDWSMVQLLLSMCSQSWYFLYRVKGFVLLFYKKCWMKVSRR